MFPVRCYTCNAVLAQHWDAYERQTTGLGATPAGKVLDALAVRRLCCRRMFLGHVDLTAQAVAHPALDVRLDEGSTVLYRNVTAARTVSCD